MSSLRLTTGDPPNKVVAEVQVNDCWLPANVIAQQGPMLYLLVELVDGHQSLQTWQKAGSSYVVVGSGIPDVIVQE